MWKKAFMHNYNAEKYSTEAESNGTAVTSTRSLSKVYKRTVITPVNKHYYPC